MRVLNFFCNYYYFLFLRLLPSGYKTIKAAIKSRSTYKIFMRNNGKKFQLITTTLRLNEMKWKMTVLQCLHELLKWCYYFNKKKFGKNLLHSSVFFTVTAMKIEKKAFLLSLSVTEYFLYRF